MTRPPKALYVAYTRAAEERRYEAEVIDTWEMTVESLGTFEGQEPIELPSKPGVALRIRPVE